MQRRILLVLVAAVIVRAQGPPEQLYREAVEHFESGDVDGAITRYQQILKLRPDSVQARTNLGVALARRGRYDEAISEYKIALRHDAANPTVRINLALAFYKQAAFEPALETLEGIPAPHSRQAQLLSADCELRLGNNLAAIGRIQPEYDRNPADLAYAYVLGTALIREHRIEQGKAVIDHIFRAGETPEANMILGAAQLEAGDHASAIRTLRKAVAAKPDLPGAWALLGRAQVDAGENEAARQSFQRALRVDANDFDANLRFGALLRRDGDIENAAKFVRRALQLRPSSIPARFQMGAVNTALGKLDEAVRDFEFVVRQSPDFQEAHVQLAAVYFRMNRRDDASRERETVLRLNEEQRRKQAPPRELPDRR